MKHSALLLTAGLMVMWSHYASAQKPREAVFTVGAEVDAQGVVTKTEAEPGVAPGVAAVLDQAIRYWRFSPFQRDGKALPVHTFITARLDVLPTADGKLDLKTSYVRQGPKSNLFETLLTYPRDAMRMRLQGLVVLAGTLPAQGRPSVSLTKCSERDCGPLQHSVIDWFQHGTWTPETVDGQPVSARANVFAVFHLIPVGPAREPSPVGIELSSPEQALLRKYGFPGNAAKVGVNNLTLSSVLRPLTVRPVLMHLGADKHS